MPSLKSYAGVARAPFLMLPVTLVAAGAAASYSNGSFSWLHTVVALVGLVAVHMAVNILNEWSDMRTGIDLKTRRTPFSGGSGTLPAGGMGLGSSLAFGIVCSACGLAVGLWFLARIGWWPLLPIMVVGAISVLLYTDFLARIGVGEIAAGLGLGALPVVGTALVQQGTIGPAAVAAAIPAFFMTFNLLLLNELPDEQADREGGRRNLVLLLGRRPAARLYTLAGLAVPVAIIGAAIARALPWVALIAVLPSLLLVKPFGWALGDVSEEVPIPALGANVVWNLSTNAVLAIALIAATLLR